MQVVQARAEAPPDLVAALARMGAGALPHSGRSLERHLTGTYRLLEAWGCDAHVCTAGLFHSIYGTNAFGAACQALEARAELQALIGDRAERLVYLFAVSERPAAFLHALSSGQLAARAGGKPHAVNREELCDLLAVECANLIEQDATPGLIETLRRLSEKQRIALLGPQVAAGIMSSTKEGIP